MYMTDAEIMSSYRKAKTPYEKRKKTRVLAELNACGIDEMRDHLEKLMLAEDVKKRLAEKEQAEIETRPANDVYGTNPWQITSRYVIEAVQLRLEEVGSLIEQNERAIRELTDTQAEYLDEWAKLTEFVKAHE